jgi:hypothetical protein
MKEKVIWRGWGITVTHVVDEPRASNFAEAFIVGARKAMRNAGKYEGEEANDARRPRSLGRHRCKAPGGTIL